MVNEHTKENFPESPTESSHEVVVQGGEPEDGNDHRESEVSELVRDASAEVAHSGDPALDVEGTSPSEDAAVSDPVEGSGSESAVSHDRAPSDGGSVPSTSTDGSAAVSSEATTPPSHPQLVLPLAEMTPEERFRATARLIFLAPDVPPVQPRQRRRDFRQLDDLLDRQFHGGREQHNRQDDDERESAGSSRRRTRRRQSETPSEEESPRREQRTPTPITEPQKVKGSTRLEAKRQRRRDGRDVGRRRRLVITESEFLARRESVDREMIVRTSADRIQIGVLEDRVLVEHYVARSSESSLIGNVYLGRVQNVLPSMEAAFVDIGRGRNAVLYSGEVDWSEFEGSASARKIENALKPGDMVLVQVTKDPVGHKGARLTSQISLPGRFLVYVPGGAMNGISRKLPDTERARLKKILKEVLPSGAGVIVRTAAEGATEDQVTGDVQRLTRQWDAIQQRVTQGGGPVLLHSEPDMLIKIVRDVFNEDFNKLVIQGEDTYRVIEGYLAQVAPELLERVEQYSQDRDIFDEYRISEQIIKALDRKVWLPSGGSLVIDRTEAMTVVDVNTGKFVGSGGNLEETVTKNNLEAAEEIVRQLRLRDIGGIIVIDFIDMVLESNRDLVLRRLVECLSRDRTKHQVAEVTSLGLVQMTRKKLGLGLLEAFSESCEVCAGRGLIVHHDPVSRHRNDTPSRSKRKNASQQQTPTAQAHAITDESRSALAKIAASTIPAAADAAESPESTTMTAATTPSSGPGKRTRRSAAPAQVEPAEIIADLEAEFASRPAQVSAGGRGDKTEEQGTDPSTAEDMLKSVLDALPPAPSQGARKRTNRRASSNTPDTGI